MSHWLLFGGSAHPQLADALAAELGVLPGACRIERFPDGEVAVRLEQSVRGRLVLLLQPTGPPVDHNLMELLAFADGCRRAAAEQLIALVPYFGYARSDRRRARREPITASLVATLIEAAGVDHLVAVDLHSPAIEGFFRIPVDNLSATALLASALQSETAGDAVVVSPDLGRAAAAADLAGRLQCDVAVVQKHRSSGREVEALQLVGEVRDRRCIITDDMISTGGTMVECIRVLTGAGARPEITVCATHAVLSDGAVDRLAAAGVTRLIVTDSLPMRDAEAIETTVVTLAPLLAGAIRRILNDESLIGLT